MQIISKKEDNRIVLIISGRLDKINAPTLQAEILNAFKSTKHLTLDFKDVDYASSAGLRTLLIGHKTATSKGGSLELCNVNKSVMEVLSIVGFCKILTIKEQN